MGLIEKINPYMAAAEAIANPLFAHLTNVKNRKFTREMYKQQRADTLSDWMMQNEYNSPRMQMQRFQEAGLNPHLIYGQMNEVGGVRPSAASGGQAEAPRTDSRNLTNSLMAGVEMERTKAQTDLYAKQLSLLDRQIENTAAQTVKTLADVDMTKQNITTSQFKLLLDKALAPFQLQKAEADIKKVEADTKFTVDQNIRAEAMQKGNLTEQENRIKRQVLDYYSQQLHNAKTKNEIAHIQAQVDLLKIEKEVADVTKKFVIDEGMGQNDSYPMRVIQRIANAISEKVKGKKKPEVIPGKPGRTWKGTDSQ